VRTRAIPCGEWDRLPERPSLLDHVHPQDAQVLVVEDEGRVVGYLLAARVTHLEGLWIESEHRNKAAVGRALRNAALGLAKRWGHSWAWAAADTPLMKRVLERMGAAKLALESYVFKLEGA
jgi:acetyltransferase (GNAT) family protein